MTSVCCVCKKILGTKPGGPDTDITHGYCDECAEAAFAEYFAWKLSEGEGGPVLPLLSISGGTA